MFPNHKTANTRWSNNNNNNKTTFRELKLDKDTNAFLLTQTTRKLDHSIPGKPLVGASSFQAGASGAV